LPFNGLAGECAVNIPLWPSKELDMTHPFVHVELNSPDPEKAKSFFVKLFQWRMEDMPNPAVPDHSYTVIRVEEGTGGGIMKQVPNGPKGWVPYVLVDDLRAFTDRAKSLGGKVMKDITEVEGMGWFSIIEDPTGAILGLWKANPKMVHAAHGAKEKSPAARKQGGETRARTH
jgi:predicted enzyme related to lactoylglutathione lyase